jgi:hypothetical protein
LVEPHYGKAKRPGGRKRMYSVGETYCPARQVSQY